MLCLPIQGHVCAPFCWHHSTLNSHILWNACCSEHVSIKFILYAKTDFHYSDTFNGQNVLVHTFAPCGMGRCPSKFPFYWKYFDLWKCFFINPLVYCSFFRIIMVFSFWDAYSLILTKAILKAWVPITKYAFFSFNLNSVTRYKVKNGRKQRDSWEWKTFYWGLKFCTAPILPPNIFWGFFSLEIWEGHLGKWNTKSRWFVLPKILHTG